MSAPGLLNELIERFQNNLDAYKFPKYNEAQLRGEFINPMFEALGWDVYNKKGYAEAYKDVIHEDAIKVGGATKAPDYSFRIGGVRKFFLETKKPSVNIKEDPEPAFQLRRYAWSAKLPLSILTDFEELAVYDTRIKPAPNDKPSTGRILYFNYNEYPEKWEEIASVFSRDAILKGSFDRFVESEKKKRGTAEVDDAFLKEIESWRDAIARNIALRNEGLTERDINYAVQLTIDRIIFLRICEDRGIEDYGRLQALINGERIYKRMFDLFYRADEKYNSGLFHFQKEKGRPADPDELTPDLEIDDKVLKDIIKGLYYPESPYEFSVLPVDILGHVYERFLGKVIRLTPGGRAKIEEKPEVRKAGGVYYTPKYIVDYIVKNTVGKLVEGKKPKQVENIRILDPACGSGSFLIGAYEYLLDWHRDWYVENDPVKYKKQIYQGAGEQWYLTTAEKKRILLNNIYGVDIDAQAVEVTKLNLLLKALEGESEETIESQLKMFRERALPDLRGNIKCGNSLIGPDFYDDTQLDLLDDEERYRINAFDWEREFGEVMKSGGFDCVIGNPPYGMVNDTLFEEYFDKNFKMIEGRMENFELFLIKGISLLNNKGVIGYIIPNTLLTNLLSRKLREFILYNLNIIEINNFGFDVFKDPTVHTCILVLNKSRNKLHYVNVKKQVKSKDELYRGYDYNILQTKIGQNKNKVIDIFFDPKAADIINKLKIDSTALGDLCYIRQCIKTGNDKIYVKQFNHKPGSPWKPTLKGRSIDRYVIKENNLYLKYGEWLARNWKNKTFYETPKIAVRETGNRIVATLDLDNRYLLSSLYSIYPKQQLDSLDQLKYILGILNSTVATYFMKLIALDITKGAFTKFRTNQLARLPIKTNLNDKEKNIRDNIIRNVSAMLKLNKQLTAAKSAPEKTTIQRQIDATDKQIDELVYELYGLGEEERRVVEGNNV